MHLGGHQGFPLRLPDPLSNTRASPHPGRAWKAHRDFLLTETGPPSALRRLPQDGGKAGRSA